MRYEAEFSDERVRELSDKLRSWSEKADNDVCSGVDILQLAQSLLNSYSGHMSSARQTLKALARFLKLLAFVLGSAVKLGGQSCDLVAGVLSDAAKSLPTLTALGSVEDGASLLSKCAVQLIQSATQLPPDLSSSARLFRGVWRLDLLATAAPAAGENWPQLMCFVAGMYLGTRPASVADLLPVSLCCDEAVFPAAAKIRYIDLCWRALLAANESDGLLWVAHLDRCLSPSSSSSSEPSRRCVTPAVGDRLLGWLLDLHRRRDALPELGFEGTLALVCTAASLVPDCSHLSWEALNLADLVGCLVRLPCSTPSRADLILKAVVVAATLPAEPILSALTSALSSVAKCTGVTADRLGQALADMVATVEGKRDAQLAFLAVIAQSALGAGPAVAVRVLRLVSAALTHVPANGTDVVSHSLLAAGLGGELSDATAMAVAQLVLVESARLIAGAYYVAAESSLLGLLSALRVGPGNEAVLRALPRLLQNLAICELETLNAPRTRHSSSWMCRRLQLAYAVTLISTVWGSSSPVRIQTCCKGGELNIYEGVIAMAAFEPESLEAVEKRVRTELESGVERDVGLLVVRIAAARDQALRSTRSAADTESLLQRCVDEFLPLGLDAADSSSGLLLATATQCLAPVLFELLSYHGMLEGQVQLVGSVLQVSRSGAVDAALRDELGRLAGDMSCGLRLMLVVYNVDTLELPVPIADSVSSPALETCLAALCNAVAGSNGLFALSEHVACAALSACGHSYFLRQALALAISKVALIATCDHCSALAWAKRALVGADTSRVGSRVFMFEALLLIAEVYDAAGFVEGCLSYLSEAVAIAERGPHHVKLALHLHALRLWHRQASDRFRKELKLQPYTTGRSLLSLQLHSACDAYEESGLKSVAKLKIRHIDRYWHVHDAINQLASPIPIFLEPRIISAIRVCAVGSETLLSGFHKSVQSPNVALQVLQQLPVSYCGFDVIRALRRRAAVESLSNGDSPCLAFSLGADSCGVSYHCLAKLQSANSEQAHNLVTEHNGSTNISSTNKAVVFAALESSTSRLLLGRRIGSSALVVGLCSEGFIEVLRTWDAVMVRNTETLRRASDRATVERWSTADKKKWWSERESVDADISEAAAHLQHLLGPWRCLLTQYGTEPLSPILVESLQAVLRYVFKSAKVFCLSEFLGSKAFTSLEQWVAVLLQGSKDGASPLCNGEVREGLHVVFKHAFSISAYDASIAVDVFLSASQAPVASVDSCGDSSLLDQYSCLKVTELRKLLKEAGASATGKKDDLIRRLVELKEHRYGKTVDPVIVGATTVAAHTILVLDECLQSIVWEALPCLQTTSCSRAPSLSLVVSEAHAIHSAPPIADPGKSWFLVDPENNLPGTREAMVPFFDKYIEKWSWRGFVAEAPTEETFRAHHKQSDVFIYCGHGGGEVVCDSYKLRRYSQAPCALLWGCSSGKLTRKGVHDPCGLALSYLISGAPSVVGCLFDVTDKDLDRLSIRCMATLFDGAVSNSVISEALLDARDVCKMKFAVGYSAVLYGLPLKLHAP